MYFYISGKKSYLYDSLSPDWAPTLKLGKKRHASETGSDRYDRMLDRKRRKSEIDESVAVAVEEEIANDGSPEETGMYFQTDIDKDLMDAMQSELQQLRTENTDLKDRVMSLETKFSMDYFRDNDEKVKHLTGLQTYTTLVILYQFLEPFLPTSLIMNKFKVMTLTLVKLRLNLSNMFLAYEFETNQSTISRLLTSTISVMYKRMKKLIKWPERETLQKTMPMEFRKNFGKKCAVIIDCFEVNVEKPTGLRARAETWSSYKHHHTIKFLIGITPQGTVSYISDAWGGRVSDKYITEHSGFLDKLLPGDLVLADRGFDVSDSVGSFCAQVKIPAFTKGRDQLSPLDVEATRKLAHSRIHVERVIGSVRQKYTILNGSLPINFLMNKDSNGKTVTDKLVTVCCGLVNLCDSVIDFN